MDQIAVLIESSESQNLEFKSSLRWDIQLSKVNKDLTKTIAKTVAGFMNANGGTLLIGVSDTGEALGIEADIASLSKKSIDGFELHLRDSLKNFLGVGIGINIRLEFINYDGKVIARLDCARHTMPVYFQDGERREFYVREGNRTQPFDVRSAYEYISSRFVPEPSVSVETLKGVVDEAVERLRLQSTLGIVQPPIESSETLPPWLRVATRKVLNLYLKTLGASYGWKRVYIISPWISVFDAPAALKFDGFLERLVKDRATAYVVTRPPEQDSHEEAIDRLRETGRANIALVPNLHSKLYTAQTHTGAFALLASANFTRQAFVSREIGLFVNSQAGGRGLFKQLDYEAAQIYRSPGRRLICKAQL